MKELRAIIAARRAAPAEPFAVATVVGVSGSSYRRPGARMLISAAGRVAGSVSGGCLEEDVIMRGQEAMALGRSEVAVYDTFDPTDALFGTGLGCRGRIEILIEPLPPGTPWALAETVDQVLATRQPARLDTAVRTTAGPGCEPVVDSYPRREVVDGADLFVERIAPPTAVVVFGGGPDVTPLIHLAREMGQYTTVVDRRKALAAEFPAADVFRCGRRGQIAGQAPLDADSAVIIMNHHYESDRDALEFVLPQRVAYVGMLGPRSRTDRILDELAKRGKTFSAEELAPLHAPAGLDLGSETPEQIALSILAEMQACLTGRSAGKLRSRSAPINGAVMDPPSTGLSIGAVLLAAGESRRMGRSKQLLPWSGTTMLRHACETALAAGAAPVVVVLGRDAAACEAEIADLPVLHMVNSRWTEGMSGSLRVGLAHLVELAPEVAGALVLLADQPLVNSGHLRALLAAWETQSRPIAAAAYAGVLGVPAVFSRVMFPELAALSGQQGARAVIARHGALAVEMPQAAVDVDTPEDYRQAAPGL